MRRLAVIFFILSPFIFNFSSTSVTTPYKFPELRFFPNMPVAEKNPVTVEGVALGRQLFYDPILSLDSAMSCSTCHNQKAAFSDAPNVFSSGRNGSLMKRNTMPLFNLAWYPAFFWDGRASGIEEQVFHPVREKNEMALDWIGAAARLENNISYKTQFTQIFGNSEIDSVQISYAIAQFLRTLISYRSKYDQVLEGKAIFTKEEYEGFILVNDQTKGDCIHCHTTDGAALATTLVFSNNGLDAVLNADEYDDKGRGAVTGKQSDNGKFMVPSLRNLAFTAPYMHDGRFKTLDEVIDFYSEGVKLSPNIDAKMEFAHKGGPGLSCEEKEKIIAFLHTLSDSAFVADPQFSDQYH